MPAKELISVEIRPWSPEDLPLMQRLLGDPAMTEYLGGPETPEQILQRHERYLRSNEPGLGPMFAIILGNKKVPVGCIGYWERKWQGQMLWETGWSVLTEYQGLGIATQAVGLVAKKAGAEGKRRFLHAFPSVDNAPSNAVCRKAGFELLGEEEVEYPVGHRMRCNDWRLDLFQAAGREYS